MDMYLKNKPPLRAVRRNSAEAFAKGGDSNE
jgi:hypothetical protein